MILNLPFATSKIALDLRGLRVAQLAPTAKAGPRDLPKLISDALDKPLDGRPLNEICRARKRVTVVVPDGTRKADLPNVLPPVFARIRKHSVDAEISVLIACGTHTPPSDEERCRFLGDLSPEIRVVNHDSRDEDSLVEVGRLSTGVPVRINRVAAEADVLITVGSIKHHYFAGFGGGPKMIFPGVAGYEEIQNNHSLVLEHNEGHWQRHPKCEPGVLDGNPLAAQIMEAADFRSPDMALCLVPDANGRIAWAGAGPWRVAYQAACEITRRWYEVPPEKYSLLVASGGGAPYDSTLIQAHKAFDAGARFLKDGGEFLYLAAMNGGSGAQEMDVFLKNPDPEAILDRLSKKWIQYGHTTLRIVEKTRRLKVHLHSGLDPDVAKALGFQPAPDPAAIVQQWLQNFAGETVAVLTGAAVFPRQS